MCFLLQESLDLLSNFRDVALHHTYEHLIGLMAARGASKVARAIARSTLASASGCHSTQVVVVPEHEFSY